MTTHEAVQRAPSISEQQANEREQLLALNIASNGLHRMLVATMDAWHAAQAKSSDRKTTSAPVMEALYDRFWYDE